MQCWAGGHPTGQAGWPGTDYAPESYAHPHPVDWATGAALMVRRSLADSLEWDETYFLYSEETDFFRRPADDGGNRLVRA